MVGDAVDPQKLASWLALKRRENGAGQDLGLELDDVWTLQQVQEQLLLQRGIRPWWLWKHLKFDDTPAARSSLQSTWTPHRHFVPGRTTRFARLLGIAPRRTLPRSTLFDSTSLTCTSLAWVGSEGRRYPDLNRVVFLDDDVIILKDLGHTHHDNVPLLPLGLTPRHLPARVAVALWNQPLAPGKVVQDRRTASPSLTHTKPPGFGDVPCGDHRLAEQGQNLERYLLGVDDD